MIRRPLFLLLLLLPLFATAQTPNDVQMHFTVDQAAADEAAGTLPARVRIVNGATVPLEQIELLLNRGMGEPEVTDPSWTCREWSTALRTISCRHAAIPPQSELVLDFTIRFPLKAGRHRQGAALVYQFVPGRRFDIHKQLDTVMYRTFAATSASDSGAGSLRDAITRLNAEPLCAAHPCRITFNIDRQTIDVLSPLPRVVAYDVLIDGTTQADTNPLGPDVELLGLNLREGNGLEVQARDAVIRGLAVGYFAGNGILFVPGHDNCHLFIEKNYIGIDATGTQARINLGRGVAIGENDVNAFIRDNVISGNFRSGVFVTTVKKGFSTGKLIHITGNRIGVAAHADTPIPNGASGIFIGPEADQVAIENNVIAHNAHFGVSIATGARYVSVNRNRMFRNALLGIDIALDGPTPPLTNGYTPTLLSATYDAATNTTTIRGRALGPANFAYDTFAYELYANSSVDADGYAETEQFLDVVPPFDDGHFAYTFRGDLRGKYISAVGIHHQNIDGSLVTDTSEISRAIRVE